MLVLSRGVGESIVIGDSIEVHVLENRGRGRQVRLGIDAPRDVPVHRSEVAERIRRKDAEEISGEA